MQCVLPLKHYSTIPYYNPDAMVHVLLTLNEPLLQRSSPRGPLGLSLTTMATHWIRTQLDESVILSIYIKAY